MTSAGYLRFPHIQSDLITFVAADDVWLAPAAGGRAWRFTADQAAARWPRLSPGGSHLAYVSSKDGGPEVYAASVGDGSTQRLSHWGAPMARVCGWTGDGEVLAVSPAGQPFVDHMRARALGTGLPGTVGSASIHQAPDMGMAAPLIQSDEALSVLHAARPILAAIIAVAIDECLSRRAPAG